jgi:hypothetical protein
MAIPATNAGRAEACTSGDSAVMTLECCFKKTFVMAFNLRVHVASTDKRGGLFAEPYHHTARLQSVLLAH